MSNLIVADRASKAVKDLADRVAKTDATVLISGQSGAGKEVYARYIHCQSRRAEAPFIALNCAAIPENMLEAMLFGYEKGAFTGAINSHTGKFEQAQGGTLLLDEISEMDLGLQSKLLRVLQERELERLGSRNTLQLDVRVIATSNRDVRAAVREGDFREDLFYRLNVFPLLVPSLAERRGDILPLAHYFLSQDSSVTDPSIMLSDEALQKLKSYSWPGNVRELDNVIQRALILRQQEIITEWDIQFETGLSFISDINPRNEIVTPALNELEQQADDNGILGGFMRDQERRVISDALRMGRSKKEAAEILGISPRTLRYKLARLREQSYIAN
ncbi:Regulatory protein AtoC [Zhongshania aliphaticivorans]|uniref:Regulatory protein AtoC n=1 Tax=Zhongshania aliphaticivorans TaxID=1470434 RepID=A0A5S9NL97_9GAMM|nr:sigma-54 dependent transcriptional regulator [Zhongshania aliphaticivorans]CAA0090770.1 Regulatory protein AtoC [Zhongshania aliphaticivorans]CAA0098272.1 Regulatory protein AtoC [Zhongshania aliphaticivorans]